MRHPIRLIAIVALAAPAGAQVFIVDASGGPGAHFSDLPAAVAAVPDGATLRVRPGRYTMFTALTKGIAVVGEDAASVIVDLAGSAALGPTQAHQAVTLANLTIECTSFFMPSAELVLAGLAGPLVISDVAILGTLPLPRSPTRPILHLDRCANAHLQRVRLSVSMTQIATTAAPTMSITASRVAIAQSEIRGLAGTASIGGTSAASTGLGIAAASQVLVASSRIIGGAGASSGAGLPSPPAGDGAPAVTVSASTATFAGRSSDRVQGGSGGYQGSRLAGAGGDGIHVQLGSTVLFLGFAPSPGAGHSAVPFQVDASSTLRIDAAARPPISRASASPSTVRYELDAAAGELVLPFLSLRPVYLPLLNQPLGALLAEPLVVLAVQLVPASGIVAVDLPNTFDFPHLRAVIAQFIATDTASGGLQLAPSALVVLP